MQMNFKAKYSMQQVLRIGLHCIKLIRDRTQSGLDKDGNPFKPYNNTTWFIAVSQATKRALDLLKKENSVNFVYIGGERFAVIKGGYANYKRAYNANNGWDGTVNLTMTGQMLGNMTIIDKSNSSFTIGFQSPEMAKRALRNIELGRDFLGLSPKDLQDATLQGLLIEGLEIEMF